MITLKYYIQRKYGQRLSITIFNNFFFVFSARHSNAFPGHQPEFDAPKVKDTYNSWKSTQRADYLDPQIRKQPILVGKTGGQAQ